MTYIDGFVTPVVSDNKQAYTDFARMAAAVFRDHGATRYVEAWGDDVPHGKLTDFYGAVKAESHESVAFAWVEWPSREARDAGMAKVMADPRMGPDVMANTPFDMKRFIYGGFAVILDA